MEVFEILTWDSCFKQARCNVWGETLDLGIQQKDHHHLHEGEFTYPSATHATDMLMCKDEVKRRNQSDKGFYIVTSMGYTENK